MNHCDSVTICHLLKIWFCELSITNQQKREAHSLPVGNYSPPVLGKILYRRGAEARRTGDDGGAGSPHYNPLLRPSEEGGIIACVVVKGRPVWRKP